MVSYFDSDFDWEEHSIAVESQVAQLPPIQESFEPSTQQVVEEQDEHWDGFFDNHERGLMYKPRRYLVPEFRSSLSVLHPLRVLEVGSGYGCSCMPILGAFGGVYLATDCSQRALDIFKEKSAQNGFEDCTDTDLWMLPDDPSEKVIQFRPNVMLSVFCLSALQPRDHLCSLQKMYQLLDTEESDGHLLFRDYGLFDMTMFRHRIRICDHTFQRQDNTICHYFSLEYLRGLAEQAGFVVVELRYATIINRNRTTGEDMRRVFVHGVFCKPRPV